MRRFLLGIGLVVLAATSAAAQVFIDSGRTVAIDKAKGVDPNVDYGSLVRFGPWDDRNYQLTAADLKLLAPNEAEQLDPIPAFFRVALRKANPESRRTGPAQYPRSALNAFRILHGGYLVGEMLYPGATRVGDRYVVEMTAGVPKNRTAEGNAVVGGEVRVTSPNGAAESAIKIHPSDTNKVVAGTNGPGGGQQMHYSTNGGTTWTQVALPLGGTCCDPAVDWSSNGQYAYTTALGNCLFACGVWFYRSADGGVTWNSLETQTPGDPRREIATSGGDKEFLHVDKVSTSPYRDNLYVTWHNNNVMKFARSTDFGNTWTTQTFSSLSEDLGIGSDIVTDANGNVYYFWPAFNSRTIRMRKSTNGGQSFGSTIVVASTNDGYDFAIPAMESRRAFIYVSAEADLSNGPYRNTVYAAWTDTYGPEQGTPSANHARIQVGYSRDGGNTWTVTTPHEVLDQSTVDRFHPWLGVAANGVVFVGYYDTRLNSNRTSVDFYYAKSTDGGQTWTPPERMTTASSPNVVDGFEWGDYNGADAVMSDFMTIFTDNRSETGGTGDSVDVYVAGRPGSSSAVCGNGVIEAGEACEATDLNSKTCGDFGCSVGTLGCAADCKSYDTSQCAECSTCNNNGTCNPGENCTTCPSDCVSGTVTGAVCGNGSCEAGDGEDCLSCPADCNGVQSGKPSNRYCCGDGAGTNPVNCTDSRCRAGKSCTSVPVVPGAFCCGDLVCASGEDCANCALDCTAGPVEICGNGVDDNCSAGADCTDPACSSTPACGGLCAPVGATCTSAGQCCSGRCRGGVCK